MFYPDLYGASYRDKGRDGGEYQIDMPAIPELEKLIAARQRFANGPQTDYFDDSHCVAFRRAGTAEAPGCVVVLTNGGGERQDRRAGRRFGAHRPARFPRQPSGGNHHRRPWQRPFPGQRRQRQRLGAGRQPVSARRRVMMTRRQN